MLILYLGGFLIGTLQLNLQCSSGHWLKCLSDGDFGSVFGSIHVQLLYCIKNWMSHWLQKSQYSKSSEPRNKFIFKFCVAVLSVIWPLAQNARMVHIKIFFTLLICVVFWSAYHELPVIAMRYWINCAFRILGLNDRWEH